MKKKLLFVLIAVLSLTLAVVLCSCQNTESTVAETTAAITTTLSTEDSPDYSTYRFYSYDELQNAFFGHEGQSYQQSIVEERPEMKELLSCLTQKGTIPTPKLNGTNISLRQKEGFNDITIFSSEMHQKPWIWYHCLYKGNYFRVQYTYASLFDEKNTENETDIVKLIEAIDPDFPNAGNYNNYDSYKLIINGKITIGNETLPCVFYEINDYSLNRVSFLYNGLYVILYADFTQLDEAFFQGFSIE